MNTWDLVLGLPGLRLGSSAPVPVDPALVEDTFTAPNGTLITAHTPDVDVVGGGWAGIGMISNNKFVDDTGTTANNLAYIETDNADVTITADVTWTSSTNSFTGIIFRYSDASNWWVFRFFAAAGSKEWQIVEFTSNSTIIRDSLPEALTLPVTRTLKIVLSGTSILCYADDVLKCDFSSAVRQAVTVHGIRLPNGQTDTVDNFKVVE